MENRRGHAHRRGGWVFFSFFNCVSEFNVQRVQYLRGEPPPGPILLHEATSGESVCPSRCPPPPHTSHKCWHLCRTFSFQQLFSLNNIAWRSSPRRSSVLPYDAEGPFTQTPWTDSGVDPRVLHYPKPVVNKLYLSFQMLPRLVDENKLPEVLLTGQGVCAF